MTRHAIVPSARDRRTAQNVLHDASEGTKHALHLGGTERTIFVRNIFILHYATMRASNVLAARQASGFMDATNDRAGTRCGGSACIPSLTPSIRSCFVLPAQCAGIGQAPRAQASLTVWKMEHTRPVEARQDILRISWRAWHARSRQRQPSHALSGTAWHLRVASTAVPKHACVSASEAHPPFALAYADMQRTIAMSPKFSRPLCKRQHLVPVHPKHDHMSAQPVFYSRCDIEVYSTLHALRVRMPQ
jgi:hypothetical protein